MLLNRLVNEKRQFVQVVSGPRQVGKTTMISQVLKDADMPSHYVSADGISSNQQIWINQQWEIARLLIRQSEKRWKQYVLDSLIEASISRDILMLTRVDKPALMRRLFVMGCQYSGQILSFNKILGQLLDAGNTTTLSNYLNLLDTAGLLNGIEKYSPDLIRQRSSSPKFQVYNTALMSAQNDLTFQEVKMKPDLWGRWVESAIGAHLINSSLAEEFSVYYWRDHNDEVDFVLLYRGKVIAIEVKSETRNKISGMMEFKKKFPYCKVYLIGASGLPVSQFLQTNPIDLF